METLTDTSTLGKSEVPMQHVPVPRTWFKCPQMANEVIFNNFLAFKAPLCSAYDKYLPKEYHFTLDTFFRQLDAKNLKLGLWIDLTNRRNYYPTSKIRERDITYFKWHHRESEIPSEREIQTFVQVCRDFIADNQKRIIGLHSTHGFNRTGFFIISYLMLTNQVSLESGLSQFADARPPGIYKPEYIRELYKRYDDVKNMPSPPSKPFWCSEGDTLHTEGPSNGRPETESQNLQQEKESDHQHSLHLNVHGVIPVLDNYESSWIRKRVQTICACHLVEFPGTQPVHMNAENMSCLKKMPYRVSWMTNGAR